MGGFGAMSYAARHPDLFGAAASFSGAVDTNNPLDIAITGDEPFGPRATQEIRWRGHNPTDLAPQPARPAPHRPHRQRRARRAVRRAATSSSWPSTR